MDARMDEVSLRLIRSEYAPARARRALHELLQRAEGNIAADAKLVVSELVSNVVFHTDNGCEVIARLIDDGLRIEVRDTSRMPPFLRPSRERNGADGFGIGLVEMLAARWGFDVDGSGKTVWAELRR